MKAIVFIEQGWVVVELMTTEGGDTKVKWWWGGDKGWMLNIGSAIKYITAAGAVDAMNRSHHTEPQTSYQNAVSTQPLHGLRTQPQSGWSCPRCSRIYGPSVQICVVCNTAVAARESK